MRRLALLVLFSACAAVLAAASAVAQPSSLTTFRFLPSRAPPPDSNSAAKPYQPVTMTLPLVPVDQGFETFRNEIAVVVRGRVYSELERLVLIQGFFWDRDFRGSFDRRFPAVDNLAAAVRLERHGGAGWATLAAFATEPTAAPLTGRPGIICAPGEPSFDEVDFNSLIDATRSNARDWAAPRADKTAVHAAPRGNAAVIDTLGLALVRVLGILAKDKEADTIRTAWTQVATPAGKTGFVAPGALMPLAAEQLCYGKDGFGRWRIAGFVGTSE